MIRRALTVADGEDVWLLDTREAAASGEYEAYNLTVKYGEFSEPHASFSALFASGRQELEEGE
jgi:hypothetical protein